MRFKDFLTEKSAAQQAAIAISKKEKGEEPKNEDAEEKARLALKHTQEKERLAQKHAREKESLSSEDIDYDEVFETTTSHFFNESVLGDARTILFREKLKKLGYARIDEKTNKNTYNMRGHKVELEKKGDSMKPEWHLKVDGKEQGVHKSEKDAIKHFQKITKESAELDEGSREADIKKTISIMKKYPANKGKSEKELRKGAIAYLDQKKESVEEKRDAGKSATGYDIYHDTYSAAMQHAYAHAKKKHGVTVRPGEIDDKVALGPKKPSTGKTVSHILKTDKKQNLHVQVYNTGRKYELNMYVESVELDEAIDFRKAFMDIQSYAK